MYMVVLKSPCPHPTQWAGSDQAPGQSSPTPRQPGAKGSLKQKGQHRTRCRSVGAGRGGEPWSKVDRSGVAGVHGPGGADRQEPGVDGVRAGTGPGLRFSSHTVLQLQTGPESAAVPGVPSCLGARRQVYALGGPLVSGGAGLERRVCAICGRVLASQVGRSVVLEEREQVIVAVCGEVRWAQVGEQLIGVGQFWEQVQGRFRGLPRPRHGGPHHACGSTEGQLANGPRAHWTQGLPGCWRRVRMLQLRPWGASEVGGVQPRWPGVMGWVQVTRWCHLAWEAGGGLL